MKVLHVFHRVFHYLMVWNFILAGVVLGYAVMNVGNTLAAYYNELEYGLDVFADYGNVEWAAFWSQIGLFALIALALVALGIFHFALSHLFKECRNMEAKKAAEKECACCCCEEPVSDLDEQVEEVMKWKNLYVEGIITEREFIDKRNEILRIAK